jgi:transposase-like protein
MSPPHRQSVAWISEELGIHMFNIYNWRKVWRLQGEVVPSSEKEPEGWSAADKFTVVLESSGLNATELSAYCRERGLFPEQVSRWRQAAQDANAKPVLTLTRTWKPYSEQSSTRPITPVRPFASKDEACERVAAFVDWYNHRHRHSGIKFVTPAQRHSGQAVEICRHRAVVYEQARQRHPRR